jgi:hypothetical protein
MKNMPKIDYIADLPLPQTESSLIMKNEMIRVEN